MSNPGLGIYPGKEFIEDDEVRPGGSRKEYCVLGYNVGRGLSVKFRGPFNSRHETTTIQGYTMAGTAFFENAIR